MKPFPFHGGGQSSCRDSCSVWHPNSFLSHHFITYWTKNVDNFSYGCFAFWCQLKFYVVLILPHAECWAHRITSVCCCMEPQAGDSQSFTSSTFPWGPTDLEGLTVLVSLDCCNTQPENGWLKPQIFVTVLAAGLPKSRCQQIQCLWSPLPGL